MYLEELFGEVNFASGLAYSTSSTPGSVSMIVFRGAILVLIDLIEDEENRARWNVSFLIGRFTGLKWVVEEHTLNLRVCK